MKVFDHENHYHYVQSQLETYNRKKDLVHVTKKELDLVVNHLKRNVVNIESGICHGVRTGFEVDYFIEKLKCNVIGTEIARTNHLHTIQMDFHDIKEGWENSFDFIYTNSFDHSNKPEYCLDQWMRCLKKEGYCYITWPESNVNTTNSADCFSGSLSEYIILIEKKYKIDGEMSVSINKNMRVILAITKK